MNVFIRFFQKKDRLVWIPALSILLVAMMARVVSWRVDLFGGYFDDYWLMTTITQPFLVYINSLGAILPQLVVYWFSNRIFGDSVQSYLVIPLIANLIVLWWLFKKTKQQWNDPVFTTLILGLICFNAHTFWLTEYALSSYAISLLATTYIYFDLLTLVENRTARRKSFSYYFWIIILAFFSNLIMLVPVFTAIFSLWLTNVNTFSLKHLWTQVFVVLRNTYHYVVIFPCVYFLTYTIHPFTNLGFELRPDMRASFFYSSGFPMSIVGAGQFLIFNSLQLFKQLLYILIYLKGFGAKLYFLIDEYVSLFAFVTIIGLASITIFLIQIKKSKIDLKILFTFYFFVFTYAAMALGGLIGRYPFGHVRYGTHLLIPAIILISFYLKIIMQWICEHLPFVKKSINSYSLLVFAIMVFLVGQYFNYARFTYNENIRIQNVQAFSGISEIKSDLVLYNEGISPAMQIRLNRHFNNGISMGYGSFHNNGIDGDVPTHVVQQLLAPHVKSVLVVDQLEGSLNTFPVWLDFMDQHFVLKGVVSGPVIYTRLYEKIINKPMPLEE